MPPVNERHLTAEELAAGMDEIRRAPKDAGVVRMIVRRPAVDERETLQSAKLDTAEGLVGDSWRQRGSPMTDDGSAHPGMQLALGDAIIEVTDLPHTGCKKFVARFGLEAMKFVNSGKGKTLCLRGINAKVVRSGSFAVGDLATRLGSD